MKLAIGRHFWRGSVLAAGLLFLFAARCGAQIQYLSVVGPDNLSLRQSINVPGVDCLPRDNSTLDVRRRRLFFLGSRTGDTASRLYTIDIRKGKLLYDPVCPAAGSPAGKIYGLRYDKATDMLYALLDSGSITHFCWIEPATGFVHTIGVLSGFAGYTASTFDTRHHRYIAFSGTQLWVVDARSGKVLFHSVAIAGLVVNHPIFDEATGSIYAICQSEAVSGVQFDSIGEADGAIHLINNLPPMDIPFFGAAAIDEAAGKYFFVGADLLSPCAKNYLHSIDVHSGNILSRIVFPDAQVIFSFDSRRKALYVLNWHPSERRTVISPVASARIICQGSSDTFFLPRLAHSGFVTWQLNGQDVAFNVLSFITNSLKDGDSVRCIVHSNTTCGMATADTSASLRVRVVPLQRSSVTLSASSSNVCAGDTVIFRAKFVDAGGDPGYQWLVNDEAVKATGSVFRTDRLVNGDMVSCSVTSSAKCGLPASSTAIAIQVRPRPEITIGGGDSALFYGHTLRLRAKSNIPVTGWQWSPVAGLDNPSVSDPLASPANTISYQVSASTPDGCKGSAGKKIVVYHELRMPDTFTPRRGGYDGVFRVPAFYGLKVVEFSIFDPWGRRVFYSRRNGEGWNGDYEGKRQPGGKYTWRIGFRDPVSGRSAMASGNVLLIR